MTWILTVALLVGLYYYWKISSRLDEDEKKVDQNDAKEITKNSARDTHDNRKENEDGSDVVPKSPKSGGLRTAKLWRRKTPNEQPGSV